MADTSKRELKRRDVTYYRRRQQNHVFAALAQLFADEAEKGGISKKELAEILGKSPSQITRWLAAPSNFELDTISDLLLAMGAEMDHRIVRFSERSKPNYVHPLLTQYVGQAPVPAPPVEIFVVAPPSVKETSGATMRPITATASSTSSVEIRADNS